MHKMLRIMRAEDNCGISAEIPNYYRFMDREKPFDMVYTSDREGLDVQYFRC